MELASAGRILKQALPLRLEHRPLLDQLLGRLLLQRRTLYLSNNLLIPYAPTLKMLGVFSSPTRKACFLF